MKIFENDLRPATDQAIEFGDPPPEWGFPRVSRLDTQGALLGPKFRVVNKTERKNPRFGTNLQINQVVNQSFEHEIARGWVALALG